MATTATEAYSKTGPTRSPFIRVISIPTQQLREGLAPLTDRCYRLQVQSSVFPLLPPDLIEGREILVTGGTGSLGSKLVERLLSGRHGKPARVVVFSRDEAKQHELRLRWNALGEATDDAIWRDSARRVQFRIGDIRDPEAVEAAAGGVEIMVHAAALKQVPTCEYFPEEAIRTNVLGAENVVRAARLSRGRLRTVIGVSTDKAVKPVNVMGMSKSLQERIIAKANLDLPDCRLALVRYGNVLASRGSVLPLFLEQAANGGPMTVTDATMTRFLITLSDAVDAVLRALAYAGRGETLIPQLPSARVVDLARAVAGDPAMEIQFTGIRPGEKLHEVLVSEEERPRTTLRGADLFIGPVLPELRAAGDPTAASPLPFAAEYSSADDPITASQTRGILEAAGLVHRASRAA